MQQNDDTQRVMTQKEAGDWMAERGVGRDSFLCALHLGQISTVRIGKRDWIPISELQRLLKPKVNPG